MSAPDTILQLVDQFASQLASYRSSEYNEAQARREFIEPFFDVLGWDMYNKQGYAYSYKDVIFEDSIKVGGATKAPDYAFRIGGTRKFFVEAKKPSVNLKDEITPAYQLRRYAWSAKLPLSILTDFEEFAVYDCRPKPDKTDKASTGRIMLLTYRDYSSHWDEIASVFSRQAVLKGSFDKYAEAATGKRGTAKVDDAFLAEIERWRDLLAHNIALRNPTLSQRDLNYAVQMTIDRLIFLRICEDRGIEFYGQLQSLLNGGETYPRLCQLFRKADERYNSGLFHFLPERDQADTPDRLTPGLLLDDKPLKDILANLYYPDSPYEFSVLPADILGQVYERFLGKVIRLTPGHHAMVEDKPEVKKAGGVFYTPTFIVEYIVKHTLGKLLEGKAPGEVGLGRGTPIRILDMSCGSGSFLLGAFQYLLDWYLSGYSNEPKKWSRGAAPQLYQVSSVDGTHWKLTTSERKRILLDHIYGVDIDPQAVEVTKLSLLLKVLEGESQESIGKQLSMFRQRALPDLAGNIKCGNSLIGPDFYTNQPAPQGTLSGFDLEEQYRINAFDWHKEFTGVFSSSGGFDVIIGNPPYVRQEKLGDVFKAYAKKNFKAFFGTSDLYIYFIEKAHKLLRSGGKFGMIISNKWMRTTYGKALRNYLVENTSILQIIDFGELPVFDTAATFPMILITQNLPQKSQQFVFVPIKHLNFTRLEVEVESTKSILDENSLQGENWSLSDTRELNIFRKMHQVSIPLEQYTKKRVYFGIKTGLNEAFLINDETRENLILEDKKSKYFIKPFVMGDDVRKYTINFKNKYLICIPKGWTNLHRGHQEPWTWFKINLYSIAKHLEKYKENAIKRQDQGDFWWELRACDYYDKLALPKIVYPDIAKESRIAFDNEGLYFSNTVYFIPIEDMYLLGILNSKLIFTYFKRIASVLGDADKGGRLRWFRQDVFKIPIRSINFSRPPDVHLRDQMVFLVERMLALHQQLASNNTPTEKTLLQRQIDTTDHQIDALVYELYGLTEDEIKLVDRI